MTKPLNIKPLIIVILILLTFFTSILLAEIYQFSQKLLTLDLWISTLLINSIFSIFIVFKYKKYKLKKYTSKKNTKIQKILPYTPSLALFSFILVAICISPFFGQPQKLPIHQYHWISISLIPIIEETCFRIGLGSIFRKLGGVFLGLIFLLFALLYFIQTQL